VPDRGHLWRTTVRSTMRRMNQQVRTSMKMRTRVRRRKKVRFLDL
jgi:hypothetical protein